MEMCKKCVGTGLYHPNANTDRTCDVCLGTGSVDSVSEPDKDPVSGADSVE